MNVNVHVVKSTKSFTYIVHFHITSVFIEIPLLKNITKTATYFTVISGFRIPEIIKKNTIFMTIMLFIISTTHIYIIFQLEANFA